MVRDWAVLNYATCCDAKGQFLMTKLAHDPGQIPETGRLAATAVFLLVVVAAQLAPAQTLIVLHNFTGAIDGEHPYDGVTLDRGGNLYGTAYEGGTGAGTVFKLSHQGSGWTFNTLSTFAGGGANPYAGVVFGANGTLYGTTSKGSVNGGNGTVFNLSPPPTICNSSFCPWTETLLYSFTGSPDGYGPGLGDVTFDPASNIYDTTYAGGSGYGIVYELTPSGGGWTENILHSFGYSDGAYPYSRVIRDSAGNLYGTTWGGGANGAGTVFELTPSGSGWTHTVLYSFQPASDGGNPYSGLMFDSSGNLYGATSSGGSGGGGTVFKLTPAGNGTWTYSVIYSFTGANDCGPQNNLAMDQAGNLYGTTYCDGANKLGNVFKLTPTGGGWTYTSLHDFTGGSDGEIPFCSVAFDASGNLYGTAVTGGSRGAGTVWEITP
jgi:uncharacterized repeat protein (TIGR03803 family)